MIKRILTSIILSLTLSASALCGEVEIRATDGSIWNGDVNDAVEVHWMQKGVEQTIIGTLIRAEKSYIVVNGEVLGKPGTQTIFRADISKIIKASPSIAGAANTDPVATPSDPANGSKPTGTSAKAEITTVSTSKSTTPDGKTYLKAPKPGVFLLPLEGTVGETFRKEEIKAIGEEADKYGPGQIIIFRVKSGGGSVVEMDQIHDILMDMRERHRLVAWIEEAISAACYTSLHCNEIYFKTNGAAGSMTMWYGGGISIKGRELEAFLRRAGEIAEIGGRNPYIVQAMVHYPLICTYDRDEATGKITYYNTMKGQYVLSDAVDNLTLTAKQAVHCGFADGIADTEQQLAKYLGLSEWYEISSYGRDIAKSWSDTVERAKIEIPELIGKMQRYMGSGARDTETKLGTAIQVIKELMSWRRRAPNVVDSMGIPPDEQLERMISDYQYELAQFKKRMKNR